MLPFLRAQDPQTTFNFHIRCDDDEKTTKIVFSGHKLTSNSPRCENFMSSKMCAMSEDRSHEDIKIKKII